MRHMGINGKVATGAFLAALGLLVLTGITLHEWVLVWFIGACATAYIACVAEVVVRRRHRTLIACGVGSTLFIAFGVAFLRQWGLAFNSDPDALSTRVNADYPDLYFYLAAATGALTLLLLIAGTVLPGKNPERSFPGHAPGRRPAPVPRGTGSRSASPRPSASRPTPGGTAARPAAPRASARPAAKSPAKSQANSAQKSPAAKSSPAKPASPKSPARTSGRR